MTIHNLELAHELDAAWIIALWKAIHGGDPSPEIVAAQAIAALAPYLKGASEGNFTFKQLETQFEQFGAQVTEAPQSGHRSEESATRALTYCFKFKNQTFCITLPRPVYKVAASGS
jgi:hypothetical protein